MVLRKPCDDLLNTILGSWLMSCDLLKGQVQQPLLSEDLTIVVR